MQYDVFQFFLSPSFRSLSPLFTYHLFTECVVHCVFIRTSFFPPIHFCLHLFLIALNGYAFARLLSTACMDRFLTFCIRRGLQRLWSTSKAVTSRSINCRSAIITQVFWLFYHRLTPKSQPYNIFHIMSCISQKQIRRDDHRYSLEHFNLFIGPA